MKWLRARLAEPSTWCAFGIAALAAGVYLSTMWIYWREFIYLSAAVSVVGAICREKGIQHDQKTRRTSK